MIGLERKLTLNQVRDRIKAVRKIDLKNADIDFLKKRMNDLFVGYYLSSIALKKGNILYRGVKWSENEKPNFVTKISYPDNSYVKTLGRCNRQGNSMFYCSISREAPFFELKVFEGDFIAISHWTSLREVMVNNVGYVDETFERYGSSREDLPDWVKLQGFACAWQREIHGFFAKEFTKDVSSDQTDNYKLSIAISEKLTEGNLNHIFAYKGRFAGLVYPSLSMSANSDNYVISPEFVDECLKLEKVEWIRVDKIRVDKKIDITVLDFADSFSDKGEIEWKGRAPNWKINSGESAVVEVRNGRYEVRDLQGNLLKMS